MSVPFKYREIGDFHEYYSGVRKAPYLTIFVGGNHEASNYLWELYYGGWVAPNIYYLGAANVVRVGPLRIAGLSGIWKGYNYNKPHHERLPYDQDDLKSIYHVRALDVRKLLQIRTQVDVGISHDWPRGVEWMGNWKALFAQKDLFEADARAGKLGSSAAKYVMDHLRPPHWFSAHLHCKFAAVVKHGEESQSAYLNGHKALGQAVNNEPSGVKNNDEIEIDFDDNEDVEYPAPAHNEDEMDCNMDHDRAAKPLLTEPNPGSSDRVPRIDGKAEAIPAQIRSQLTASLAPLVSVTTLPNSTAIQNTVTRFLALDKCLPNRKFLQIIDIDPISQPQSTLSGPSCSPKLFYDKEWLAITRVFASELTVGEASYPISTGRSRAYYAHKIYIEEKWVSEHISDFKIPENFEITAPVFDPAVDHVGMKDQPREYTNPQTSTFCELVGIPNLFHTSEDDRDERMRNAPRPPSGGGGGNWDSNMDRGRGGARGRGRGRGRVRGWGRREH